jgi:hypothetical protein
MKLPPLTLPKKEAATTNGNTSSKKAIKSTKAYITYITCSGKSSFFIYNIISPPPKCRKKAEQAG